MSAEKPDGWRLILVPFSFTIDGYDDATGKPHVTSETHWKQLVEIGNWSTTVAQRQLYKMLLEMDWLPSALRRAVMAGLDMSLRDQKRRVEEARTITLRHLIKEREQTMRAQGQRPRGGVREAALAEIADSQGMEPTALKQRLRRFNQRARKKNKTKQPKKLRRSRRQ